MDDLKSPAQSFLLQAHQPRAVHWQHLSVIEDPQELLMVHADQQLVTPLCVEPDLVQGAGHQGWTKRWDPGTNIFLKDLRIMVYNVIIFWTLMFLYNFIFGQIQKWSHLHNFYCSECSKGLNNSQWCIYYHIHLWMGVLLLYRGIPKNLV